MSSPLPAVSVIIATMCEGRRRESLYRAIASLVSQEDVATEIILAVNGDRYDPVLLSELERRGDLHLHYRAEPGLPGALRFGRSFVKTEYFAFLDDDDELLPHALRSRIDLMLLDSGVDVAVEKGFRGALGSVPTGRQTAGDPLRELLENNWLSSCGGAYRSSRIGVEFFDDIPAYAEWTYLAYKIVLSRQVAFVDRAGHLIHDTESSTSKSQEHIFGQVAALKRILQLNLPADVRKTLKEKYGASLHDAADQYRLMGEWGNAWNTHLKSLMQPNGWRYALYTRKLLDRRKR